jgi:multidrug efflux pump subunit AcrB
VDCVTRAPQFLGNVATVQQTVEPAALDHYTVQRVIDVNAGVSGRDLGATSNDVQRAIDSI